MSDQKQANQLIASNVCLVAVNLIGIAASHIDGIVARFESGKVKEVERIAIGERLGYASELMSAAGTVLSCSELGPSEPVSEAVELGRWFTEEVGAMAITLFHMADEVLANAYNANPTPSSDGMLANDLAAIRRQITSTGSAFARRNVNLDIMQPLHSIVPGVKK